MAMEILRQAQSIRELPVAHPKKLLTDAGYHFYTLRAESVVLNNPRNHPLYYEQSIRELMQDGEHWPIILGTHKAHPAGFLAMEEARDIKNISNSVLPSGSKPIQGSLLYVAESMDSARQEKEIQGYFDRLQPIVRKLGAEIVYVMRSQDYTATKELLMGKSKEERHDFFTKLKAQRSQIENMVANGRIPVILPEASVESGRQKKGAPNGVINGMIKLHSNAIVTTAASIESQGKKPFLVFMGNTGENNIYNPITKAVTPEAKQIAKFQRFQPLMSSVVDYPIEYATLVKYLSVDGKLPDGAIEQYCGERLAQLIPHHERGDVYRIPTRLGQVPAHIRPDLKYIFGE